MRGWRTGVLAAGLGVALLGVSALMIGQAFAHGSMQNPMSRTYECFLEGPEHPQSAACKAAVALGGTQPLYDWNEVHILDAAGRSRQIIPDGKLCGAGLDKYRGFDLPRADWPASTLPTSGSYTFQYKATAPHRGTFYLYVTRTGYDPTKPLKWSDLEDTPFLSATDPALSNGSYTMTGALPTGRRGRHLIYSIWQRSDSPEAFYTCSDVIFGSASPTPSGSVKPSPSGSVKPSPSGSPKPSPSGVCTAPTWLATKQYNAGDVVSYNAHTWKAQWWTTNETPGSAQVWLVQSSCTPTSRPPAPCTAPVWASTTTYTQGNQVSFNSRTWIAKWWTVNEQPGTAQVWDDQGPC